MSYICESQRLPARPLISASHTVYWDCPRLPHFLFHCSPLIVIAEYVVTIKDCAIVKCQMSKWIHIAQFHGEHLNCARSSSMSAERHRRSQPVHTVQQAVNSRRSDPRQRRPAERVCYVDSAERSSGAGWLIVDVDWQRRRPECSSWPDTLTVYTLE